VNLSRDEIRHLQIVLNQKGFHIGKADGILGPHTRNALIAFQRQQGLEPTGGTDQQTIIALGISNDAASRTSGQGGSGTQ
jgi:peptidoglycan hydrolase-like protein with peptidoglycan-binding domain